WFSFFFFSSRRRHTRSKRDWSSDVCSSDLPVHLDIVFDRILCTLAQVYKVSDQTQYRGGPAYYIEKGLNKRWLAIVFAITITFRSEERRVGKAGTVRSGGRQCKGIVEERGE